MSQYLEWCAASRLYEDSSKNVPRLEKDFLECSRSSRPVRRIGRLVRHVSVWISASISVSVNVPLFLSR